jgi:hypothetical protein
MQVEFFFASAPYKGEWRTRGGVRASSLVLAIAEVVLMVRNVGDIGVRRVGVIIRQVGSERRGRSRAPHQGLRAIRS